MIPSPVVSSIYSNFGAYRTPKTSEYERVMRSGMVVLDANVLLSLYRYNDQARLDLLGALRKIEGSLWVPYQVMKEFWLGRLSAIGARERRAQQLCADMEKVFQNVRTLLRDWAPTVSLKDEQLKAMFGRIDDCSEKLQDEVQDVSSVDSDRSAWSDTNNDPVVSELETILDGRVGAPLGEDEEKAARKEASRRAELEIPPGYKDAKKDKKQGADSGDSAGDYLLWYETLQEAERRKCDVLFVTGDVKDDWWRRKAEQLLGPRPELVEELKQRTGCQLYMLQPHLFLATANESFNLKIDPESVASVERAEPTFDEVGWTKDDLRALLEKLDENAPTRSAVIRRAIAQNGYVSRKDIYEIGKYKEDRLLTGWTRPIRTWTQYLQEKGEIQVGERALDILEPLYDGPGRATGFRIPAALLELFEELDKA